MSILGHQVIRRLQEDLRSNTPIPRHAQIYDALRELIERGDLKGGAHLPPLCRFSKVLLVGGGTVRAAAERLVQHGYLEPRTTHGYRVRTRS